MVTFPVVFDVIYSALKQKKLYSMIIDPINYLRMTTYEYVRFHEERFVTNIIIASKHVQIVVTNSASNE